MTEARERKAVRLVHEEGLLLDERRWSDWLDLYLDDAVFWVPAWRNEEELCEDPSRELSLIYISNKSALADRIFRMESNQSAASAPLPRTAHAITNTVFDRIDDAEAVLRSSWSTNVYSLRGQTHLTFFGRCEHRLKAVGGEWRIALKKVVLANDTIPSMMDFYFL